MAVQIGRLEMQITISLQAAPDKPNVEAQAYLASVDGRIYSINVQGPGQAIVSTCSLYIGLSEVLLIFL
jgi:hypothetical protein